MTRGGVRRAGGGIRSEASTRSPAHGWKASAHSLRELPENPTGACVHRPPLPLRDPAAGFTCNEPKGRDSTPTVALRPGPGAWLLPDRDSAERSRKPRLPNGPYPSGPLDAQPGSTAQVGRAAEAPVRPRPQPPCSPPVSPGTSSCGRWFHEKRCLPAPLSLFRSPGGAAGARSGSSHVGWSAGETGHRTVLPRDGQDRQAHVPLIVAVPPARGSGRLPTEQTSSRGRRSALFRRGPNARAHGRGLRRHEAPACRHQPDLNQGIGGEESAIRADPPAVKISARSAREETTHAGPLAGGGASQAAGHPGAFRAA